MGEFSDNPRNFREEFQQNWGNLGILGGSLRDFREEFPETLDFQALLGTFQQNLPRGISGRNSAWGMISGNSIGEISGDFLEFPSGFLGGFSSNSPELP